MGLSGWLSNGSDRRFCNWCEVDLLMSLSGWFCPVGLKLNILSRWVLVEGLTGEPEWKF